MRLLETYLIENYVLVVTVLGMGLLLLIRENGSVRRKRDFVPVLVSILLLSICETAGSWLAGRTEMLFYRYAAYIGGYILRPLLLMLCLVVLEPKCRQDWVLWLMSAVNALLQITSPMTHWTFWFDESGTFFFGKLYFFPYAISLVYAAILVIQSFRLLTKNERWECVVVAFMALGSMCAAGIDALLRTSLLLPTVSASVVLYYLYLHIQDARVRELEQQLELNEKQQELMVSQIQPHFLYNTLATIRYLCRHDPEQAAETVGRFASYLRQNMNVIGQKEPIPFSTELEQVKNYAAIEMLRFENVRVEYDLKDTDFVLPALSVQPLVENAIKHGVRYVENGRVLVSTEFRDETHIIRVEDNGKGFDTKTADYHVGIANVRDRLKRMTGGTLEITSAPGEGTVSIIRIPDGGS